MHVAKIYSKQHQCAFVVLGHCKDFGEVMLEIDLFTLQTGIKLPRRIKCEEIALGQWQNMVIVKFDLHPACVFNEKTGSYGDWMILDDSPELLEKIRIKTFKKEQ